MDDQPSRAFYYTGMLALFFGVAFLLSTTVFREKKVSSQFSSTVKSKDESTEKKALATEIPAPNSSATDEEVNDSEGEESFDFEEPSELREEGSTVSFEKMLQLRADSIRSALADGKRRTDIILRYYPHQPDGKIVYSLSDLGFYLHERPTDIEQLDEPTNALFYGDNVALADIQMVAYELIKRGATIRQIKMSRFHDDWKANSIEIGAEPSAKNLPVLSLEDIKNFRKSN